MREDEERTPAALHAQCVPLTCRSDGADTRAVAGAHGAYDHAMRYRLFSELQPSVTSADTMKRVMAWNDMISWDDMMPCGEIKAMTCSDIIRLAEMMMIYMCVYIYVYIAGRVAYIYIYVWWYDDNGDVRLFGFDVAGRPRKRRTTVPSAACKAPTNRKICAK